MSLHPTEWRARVAASQNEINDALRAKDRRHSSGHRLKRYGVRRAYFFLWEVYVK